MMHIESGAIIAQATFGRDGAMFESLLGFVAQLSLVLWSLVVLTVVIRFVGIGIYRRGAARMALVETVAPVAAVPAAVVPTITAEIDLIQPSEGQLTDAGLVRLSLFGSIAAEKDAVTNATFDEVLQPAEAPAAVAASVNVPRSAPRNLRAEPRSAAHVHALAANSTEA